MIEEEKSSAEDPGNQVPVRSNDNGELPSFVGRRILASPPSKEMESKVVLSPAEIRDGIVVVKFFKESLAMDEEEYSVNIHRLLKFWRRLMKVRK